MPSVLPQDNIWMRNSPRWFWKPFHATVRAAALRLGGHFGRLDEARAELPLEGRARAGGIRLAYLGWPGDGPTVVLVHGLDGNPWCWARTAARLAGRRRVLAVALRGHGRSDTPGYDYGFDTITRDLLAFFDEMGLEQVILGGHSWGGKVALHAAATAPERVSALVLADPAAPGPHHPLFRAAPFLMETALSPERQVYDNRASWEAGARDLVFLRWHDEIDRRIWEEMFVRDEDGRYLPRLPVTAFEEILYRHLAWDLRPMLPRLTMPTLLLRPTFTVTPFPSQIRPFRRHVPRLSETRVEGDHNCPNSNPIDTAAAIEAFLGSARLA